MTNPTKPITEQITFKSGRTGDWDLDAYLEAAELGNRPIFDLLADIFDNTGIIDPGFVQFRANPTTADLEYRLGPYLDDSGWATANQKIFNVRGAHANATAYKRLDCVTNSNNFYVCHTPHTSTATLDPTKWTAILDTSPLATYVADAQYYANQATSAAASVTGAVNIPTQTFAGNGSQTAFTLSLTPSSAQALLVTIDNVVQEPTTAYTTSGTTLTFTSAPGNGSTIITRYLGGTLNQMPVVSHGSTYSVAASDNFKLHRHTATLTQNLTAAATLGNGFFVAVRVASGTTTVDPNGSETIDGFTTKAFTSDFYLWCDGSAWYSFQPTGQVPLVWVSKTANYTAVSGDQIIANTSGGTFTITLPASPSAGANVSVMDGGQSFATNNLIIARNGSTIMGLSEDMAVDVDKASFVLVYTGTTWRLA